MFRRNPAIALFGNVQFQVFLNDSYLFTSVCKPFTYCGCKAWGLPGSLEEIRLSVLGFGSSKGSETMARSQSGPGL